MLYVSSSIDHKDYPVKDNVVRSEVQDVSRMEQKGNDLVSTKFNTFDLGGYYPPRLLNMVIAAMGKNRVAQFYG